MAVPVVVKVAAKKILLDIVSEPEKLFKYILYIIIAFFVIAGIFIFPIILLFNVPSILLFSSDSPDIQMQIVEMYKNAPNIVNNDNISWIEETKNRYSYCDYFDINYDFNLDWYILMAIDAVRNNQDFTDVSSQSIQNLADLFFYKDSYTTTHTEKVLDYKEKTDENGNTIYDENGNPVFEPYWDDVTKVTAHIHVYTYDYEYVLEDLGFDEQQRKVILNMYNSIKNLDNGISLF